MLSEDGIEEARWELTLSADVRYVGQGYELTIPWPALDIDESSLSGTIAAFHDAHRERFLHADPLEAVEFVTLRVAARGRLDRPRPVDHRAAGETELASTQRLYLDGSWQDVPVRCRSNLTSGSPLLGPALIEEDFTTILVSSGWQVEMRQSGDLVARQV